MASPHTPRESPKRRDGKQNTGKPFRDGKGWGRPGDPKLGGKKIAPRRTRRRRYWKEDPRELEHLAEQLAEDLEQARHRADYRPSNDDLARRIKWARLHANYSQQQLASLMGIAMQTVHNWETGKTPLDELRLIMVARATGVKKEYMLFGLDPSKPQQVHQGGLGLGVDLEEKELRRLEDQ